MNRIDTIKEKVYYYRQAIFDDLSLLINQASWRDKSTITTKDPFGRGISQTFELMKDLCLRENFSIDSVKNYAFHTTLERLNPVKIAIACHLDTVPINDSQKWNTNPLELSEVDNIWYGLGVNDNKGPAIASLYVLKIIKELDLIPKESIRIIFGGAEETTWECIQQYRNHFSDPNFVLVNDGNFPIVLIEKGILRLEFSFPLLGLDYIKSSYNTGTICQHIEVCFHKKVQEFHGNDIPSRHPYRGKDALNLWADTQQDSLFFNFLKKWDDGYGKQWNLDYQGEKFSANCSNTFALLGADGNNEKITLYADIRYMTIEDRNHIIKTLQQEVNDLQGSMHIHLERPLIHEKEEDPYIQTLLSTYRDVSGDNTSIPLVMGAISYARSFNKAITFGPCFPKHISNSHKANESMPIKDLLESIIIYIESIVRLYDTIY